MENTMENAYDNEIAAVSTAMRIGFAKEAYDWQAQNIRSIIRSSFHGVVVHLLVQATGGGKSLVRDTAAFILGGVCLTISPLLVLGSDQSSKLKTMIQAGTGIKVVHLDEIPAGSVQEKQLFQDIDNLSPSPEKTLLLFSSPQRISDSESWTKELPRMIHAEVLTMVCVDEAHLYVMHGLYFRPKFFKLKEILFDKMKNSNIPVVFMTATATKDMIGHIKQLSGLEILSENITWPSSEGIQRRDVIVEVCWKEQVIRDFKDLAGDILRSTEFTKIIVYTNSKALSNELASKIKGHLNNTGLPGDVIHVDGDLFKEQKFHNIAIFLHHGKIGNPKDPLNPLDPRILVATSGAANAGIDSADVYLVLRDGFPPSIADLLQELGRAGRRMASSCITGLIDRYRINISLKSFVSLVKRIRAAPMNGSDTSTQ
jgi:superfamily II DNA helicase RecQ